MALKSERFEMRLDLATIKRLDGWRRKQDDLPSRAEAIRRLVHCGLNGDVHMQSRSEEMHRLHKSGMSFDKIGKLHKLSGERARQIVNRHVLLDNKGFLSVRAENVLKSLLGNNCGEPKEISKLSVDRLVSDGLSKKCIIEIKAYLKPHGFDLRD